MDVWIFNFGPANSHLIVLATQLALRLSDRFVPTIDQLAELGDLVKPNFFFGVVDTCYFIHP